MKTIMKIMISAISSLIIGLVFPDELNAQTWSTEWTNNGNDWIGPGGESGWHLQIDDRYTSGKLLGDNAQLFIANPSTGFAAVLTWTGSIWYWLYGNGGTNTLGTYWTLNSNDDYLIGNFDATLGAHLLAVNKSDGQARLLQLIQDSYGYLWSSYWNNGTSRLIGTWGIGGADKYLMGNFTGATTKTELLCINSGTNWATLLRYAGGTQSQWIQQWSNNGNNWIGPGGETGWHLDGTDKYVSGDYDGDGKDELLCISPGNNWAAVLKYNGSGWTIIWSNSGNGWIGPGDIAGWHIASTDAYQSGKYDGVSRARFLAFNYGNGWAGMNRYSDVWNGIWGNGGVGNINGWAIQGSDRYLTNYFSIGQVKLLLIENVGGWAAMMKFNSPAYTVSMNGPTEVYHPQKGTLNQYTWTANASGGTPPYTYAWTKNGSPVGTNSSTYTENLSYNGDQCDTYYQFTLRVDVTGGGSAYATKDVTAWNSCSNPMFTARLGTEPSMIVLPEVFSLSQNYPNPFNPETQISFGLPEPSDVTITISDLLGREVVKLASGKYSPGYHNVRWAGTDASGNKVGSGIYFYRITAVGESGKQFVKVMKMALMK